jgi:flavoprotein
VFSLEIPYGVLSLLWELFIGAVVLGGTHFWVVPCDVSEIEICAHYNKQCDQCGVQVGCFPPIPIPKMVKFVTCIFLYQMGMRLKYCARTRQWQGLG